MSKANQLIDMEDKREESNRKRKILYLEPLMLRDKFDTLSPFAQGYVSYMEASWPGSPVPEICIYPTGTQPAQEWAKGERAAILAVQDSED